jgi:hypothetical protein
MLTCLRSKAISEEGYTTLPELRELDDHEVDKMVDHNWMTMKWTRWWTISAERWNSRYKSWAAKRGASLCRMTYVYRVKKTVTDEDRLAVYGCHDDMLYNCTILAGPQFKIDDSLVFEELKNALQHSTRYAFIKPFNATKNGRMADANLLTKQC